MTEITANLGLVKGPQQRRLRLGAIIGLGLLACVAVLCLLPTLLDLDPAKQDLMNTLGPPSAAHPLGTDHLGRDMLARLAYGGRLSLSLAGFCVAAAMLGGSLLGLLAAAFPGAVDKAIAILTDAILALPGLLLILLLSALAPGQPWALALGIALTSGVEILRFTRATARTVLTSPAVEASQMLGFGTAYILRTHVWPTLHRPLATLAAFGIATAIVALATLGFIGAGFRPPTPEWGAMTAELMPYWREAPWLILQPALLIAVTVLGLHLLAGEADR